MRQLFLSTTLYFLLHTAAFAESQRLFDYVPVSEMSNKAFSQRQTRASYPISINKSAAAMDRGDHIQFTLPDNSPIDITVSRRQYLQNGDTQISGTFADDGMAILTFGKRAVFGSFTSTEHNYSISINSDGDAFFIDHENSGYRVDLGNDMRFDARIQRRTQTNDSAANVDQPQMAGPNNKSKVTLLAIYSREFGTGFTNPVTRINQMIAFTNAAYQRSGIHIELELAHAQQIAFNNSTNISTLLSQATNAQGAFSNVPRIRDQYYADLVAVLPFSTGNSVGGVAWVNGNNPRFAYSVTKFASWGSDSVFAHEIGHNLGSGHERISANPNQGSPCSGGYTGFSCGHGNGVQGTIMSYLNERAWNYVFSNPQLDCAGEPCGIASGRTNAADNRTSFNTTGPLVARFRIDDGRDLDRDGIDNEDDNCPNVANPGQADLDNDGQGDVCDDDDDGDGVNDVVDNCPVIPNPSQEDSDDNGIGDACDQFCVPIKAKNGNTTLVCL